MTSCFLRNALKISEFMLKKIENALENMIFLFSVSILFARINIQTLLNQDAFIVQGKLCKILSVLWKKNHAST